MKPLSDLLPDPARPGELAPEEVKAWLHLAEAQRPLLLDCREQDEVDFAKIIGSRWIRLAEIQGSAPAIRELAPQGVVIYCHLGMRSLRAAQILRAYGIAKAFSLSGGIAAWSQRIDPSIPRY